MRETPPSDLVELLSDLGLVCGNRMHRVAGRVRRLARDLPRFESVWIDALAQARVLSPFQAAELNAGRGRRLRIGPFVLCQPLASPVYGRTYLARQIQGGRLVRLTLVSVVEERRQELVLGVGRLLAATAGLDLPGALVIEQCGLWEDGVWTAARHVECTTAGEWIVLHGRMAPEAVLEVARQAAALLAALESHGVVHGDLAAHRLLLDASGTVYVPEPGLRGLVRPAEGYGQADLPLDAYDGLAPERVIHGTPPTVASDLYACGCLWWHLLSGRTPLSGATGVAKLQAAQRAHIADIRRLAPDVSQPLATVIASCTRAEPALRPESLARLAAQLGPSTRLGRTTLARVVGGTSRPRARLRHAMQTTEWSRLAPAWGVAVVGCLLALAVATWPRWRTVIATSGAAAPAEAAAQAESLTAGPPARRPEGRAVLAAYVSESVSAAPGPTVAPQTVAAERPAVRLAPGLFSIETLRLGAGGTVCSADPLKRATIRIPAGGWELRLDGVVFENIDFISQGEPTASASVAALRVRAARVGFHGCTFRAAAPAASPGAGAPVAIALMGAAPSEVGGASLPTVTIELRDCALAGYAAALWWPGGCGVVIEATNSLWLGPGPLIALMRCPVLDEPLTLALDRVTLRQAPLLACVHSPLAPRSGRVAIHARNCVLVPPHGEALIRLEGSEHPGRLLQAIVWRGQGSVLAEESPLVQWRRGDGQSRLAADEALSFEGLVRSSLGFAGAADARPASSQLIRWQAPLAAADPPGIDDRLPDWPLTAPPP